MKSYLAEFIGTALLIIGGCGAAMFAGGSLGVLGIALAFGLTLGSVAVAVAFALAFGLGGRQPAERLLTDLLDKAKTEVKQPNALYQNEKNSTNTVSPTASSSPDLDE